MYTQEIVDARVGTMSLIGVGNQRPCSWGNYFWLTCGSRVANFWAENLESANEQFNLGGKVKIRRYVSEGRDYCLIDDDRIPQDWYYNKLCFTGTYPPAIEALEDMYSYLGDPDNELEQYANPEKYWTDRGGSYRNGMITFPAYENATQTIEYKAKIERGTAYYFAPYPPNIEINENERTDKVRGEGIPDD